MIAAVCQFEDLHSAVNTTVNVLQSCIPVAKIGLFLCMVTSRDEAILKNIFAKCLILV